MQEKLAESENWESMVVATEFPNARETCCENTSRNWQNFLKIRNKPNYTLTLVSWRILEKDNSSLHLMKKNLMICRHYVESTHNLEMKKHPELEGGFVETRRSAQSWM